MKRPNQPPAFSKALLSGALTGIIAAVINIVYDIVFRSITRYLPAEEFNFFSITIASMIILVVMGILFFLFIRYLSAAAFTIALSVIIITCICITVFLHSDKSEPALYGNHGLIAGFTLLSGLLALTLLPYFYKHPKIYI